METTSTKFSTARLGNGASIHLADTDYYKDGALSIICNRWGSVNGVIKAAKPTPGLEATCKRCEKIAMGAK